MLPVSFFLVIYFALLFVTAVSIGCGDGSELVDGKCLCSKGYTREQGVCQKCPVSTTTNQLEGTECSTCQDGYFSVSGGGRLPACQPCPYGYTTNALVGYKDCIACVGASPQCRPMNTNDQKDEIITRLTKTINSMQAAMRDMGVSISRLQRQLDAKPKDEHFESSAFDG